MSKVPCGQVTRVFPLLVSDDQVLPNKDVDPGWNPLSVGLLDGVRLSWADLPQERYLKLKQVSGFSHCNRTSLTVGLYTYRDHPVVDLIPTGCVTVCPHAVWTVPLLPGPGWQVSKLCV